MIDKIMIEKLHDRGIRDIDIELWNEKYSSDSDPTLKEIAAKHGIKSPNTVSKRIKKVQRAIIAIASEDSKVGRSVAIQPRGSSGSTQISARGASSEYNLALPTTDPFASLQSFQELGQISSAGGAVFGAGAASLHQGFTRTDLPFEKRMDMVMKGGSVVVGGLLSLMVTLQNLSGQSNVDNTDTQSSAKTADPSSGFLEG